MKRITMATIGYGKNASRYHIPYINKLNQFHIKSSQLVSLPYAKFILHGTYGSYIKYEGDQQENDLKLRKLPSDHRFGQDTSNQYGEVKYLTPSGDWIQKRIPTIIGGYEKYYESIYETIINKDISLVSNDNILITMEILEKGLNVEEPTVLYLKK